MDVERKRLQDDLRGVIEGDVYCDEYTCQLYASDASIYQLRPLGVARPRSAADVSACVRYALENQLTLHPRGAGTGVAGESLGRGIVLDFSRYMRRWYPIDDGRLVRVQSGVVLAELNRELSAYKRLYGPDPATRSVTTIGGMINIDASGSHWLRYGSVRETIESLQVVTASGQILELSQHEPTGSGVVGGLARNTARIIERYERQLQHHVERLQCTRGGYRLDNLLVDGKVDLTRLIAGSEGTLALVTEATLRTEPIPTHRGVACFFFRRLDAAARAALVAVEQGVVACDLMDRRLMEIARETDARYEQLIPRDAEALILTELQGEALPQLQDRMDALVDALCGTAGLAYASSTTTEQKERDFYWRLCRRVIPSVYQLKGDSRALPFVEDLLVDPGKLPAVLTEIQEALRCERITAFVFAHAGHGQLQIRPFLDLSDPVDQRRVRTVSELLSQVVWRHGGTVSGAHASGLSRSWLLPRQYGDLWPAMAEVKRLFDPNRLFNPGKITGSAVQRPNQNLRPVEAVVELIGDQDAERKGHKMDPDPNDGTFSKQLPLLQVWPIGRGIERVTRQCNGCGRCRTRATEHRQCPVFRALPGEEASPRAKANLLRGVLTGDLAPADLATEQAKQIADLCFNCHQCRLECPASVDIPKIVTEIKGQYVATNGLPLSDLLLCRIDALAPILSRFSLLTNWVIRNDLMRWFLERTFGLSSARKLPEIASRPFLKYAARHKLTKPTERSEEAKNKVLYFVDYFTNHHDPSVGRALVEVLRHNNIEAFIPAKQFASGMARISAGDLKGATKLATKNIRLLADAVRQGYKVITTEPAATLCLRREYLHLVDSEEAHLVAQNTYEACRYLWDLHSQDQLATDFQPINARVAYHQPCHVRAVDDGQPGPQLLELIPGLDLQKIDAGCSGMAGTWGLQKKNYRNSLRIGWPVIVAMRRASVQLAATECSACRLQIEHGTESAVLHPLKLMAYAYGKMPEVKQLLEN